jgi:putative FmdB family regulatory protein
MPTYEYECSNCGNKFEKFQSITAAPIKKCPVCGKNTAKRLIGMGAGLIFKGSGFYITDYRSDSYKERAKSESGASTDGKAAESKPSDNGVAKDSKPATKAESAPAAKSEPKPAGKSEPKPPKTKR